MTKRSLLQLFTMFVFVATSSAVDAQSSSRPVVILFVGNSFFHGSYQPVRGYNVANVTDENAGLPTGDPRAEGAAGPYGGIPGIFKKLTDELGLNYEVHSELASGKSLEFHFQNALPIIQQAKWNVVVMHDFSTQPVPAARTGKPELFAKYVTQFEQSIHAANKSAQLFLYETWSRADLTYPAKGPYFGEKIDVMGHDLHDGYCKAFTENGHFKGIAAAGDACLEAIHSGLALAEPAKPEAGKLNLWGADSYHPSIYGAYLNALVLVKQVTGKDPRALGAKEQAAADLGIAPDVATKLQSLAAEQKHSCSK
ncbi:MAG: hypothetical protein ABJB74_15540 [Gemmatimonas sp.]